MIIDLHLNGKLVLIVGAGNEALKRIKLLENEGCQIIVIGEKPNSEIIPIHEITQGAAETVLKAKNLINNDDELIIANSDQWIDWNQQHFLSFMRKKEADGGIVTFISTHPKWSYVRINDENLVEEVAEKRPISNIATVGVYYFKHGKDFVKAAEQMMTKNIRTNNEFYVAPVFNEMITSGKKIHIYPIAEMKGLGTPEDLRQFLVSPPNIIVSYD